MIMFCGLPVIVATDPTFEAVARPTRYGIGGRFSRWQRCKHQRRQGDADHVVDQERRENARQSDRHAQQRKRPGKPGGDPFRRQCEEARHAQDTTPRPSCRREAQSFRSRRPWRLLASRARRSRAWRPLRPGRSPRGRSASREPCRGRAPGRSGRRSSIPKGSRLRATVSDKLSSDSSPDHRKRKRRRAGACITATTESSGVRRYQVEGFRRCTSRRRASVSGTRNTTIAVAIKPTPASPANRPR